MQERSFTGAWVRRLAAVGLAIGAVGAVAAPAGVNLLPQAEFKEDIVRLPGADSPTGRLHEAETARYTDTRTTAGGGGSVSATAANLSTVQGAPLLAVQGMASFSGAQVPGEEVVTATVEVNYWFEVIAGGDSVPIQLPLRWTADGVRDGAGSVMVQWEASITPQINRFRGLDTDGRFFSANTVNGLSGFHDDAATLLTVSAGTAEHEYYKVHLKLTGSAGRGPDPFRRGGGGAFSATLDPLPRVDPAYAGAADVRFVFSDNLFAAPVPEPGTWMLWLAGLGSLWRLQWQRRRVGRRRGLAAAALFGLLAAGSSQAEVSVSVNISGTRDVARIEQRSLPRSALLLAAHCGQRYQVLADCSGGLGGPFHDWEGTRLARADDQRGALGVRVHMAYADSARWLNPSMQPVGGDATASLEGDLVVGGSQGGTLALQMDLDGHFDGTGMARAGAGASLHLSVLRAATGRRDVDDLASIRLHWQPGETDATLDWPVGGDVQIDDLDHRSMRAVLHAQVPLVPGDIVRINGFLTTSANGYLPGASILADFGNTAQLSLRTTPGLVLTPVEAGFLQLAPVPEPASGALWLAGLGLGLLTLRGRQPAWRRRLTLWPMLFAAGLLALPAVSQAQASASVTLAGIATPFQLDADVSQPERASALLSGGGALVGPGDDTDGHGDFLVGATADLARGTLRGFAQLNIVGQGVADAHTQADLFDTLTFDGSRPVPLRLRLAVHGAFLDSGNGFHEVVARLRVGSQTEQATLNWYGWTYQMQHNHPVRVVGGQAISTEAANTIVWLTVDQMVMPGVPVDVVALLRLNTTASPNSLVNLNFGNTAQLWLQVPEGVTYTSASGRFLVAQPVPEPGTAALWLAGLAGLWRWRAASRR